MYEADNAPTSLEPIEIDGCRLSTGAVTLIQRFGSALNLNIHFHMLFLHGVYFEGRGALLGFRRTRAPTSAELFQRTQTLAHRIGRYLERRGLLERDADNACLISNEAEADTMEQLLGSSITYCIAAGAHQGRKVFTLQTLPDGKEPLHDGVG